MILEWVKRYEHNGVSAFIKPYTTYTLQFKMDVLNYMAEHGTSSVETAAIFNVSSASNIRRWKDQFEACGVEALQSKKKGRPSMKKDNQKQSKKQVPTEGSVEAVEIIQSPMKRLLGLAEIKLISAGSVSFGEEALETNSLYPFLPVKRAYDMIQEILPTYDVSDTMTRLSMKSFWSRLVKPSWFWIIATIALFYFKPPIFKIDQAWWIVSVGLLLLIAISRILDYFNTRYILNRKFIQFKTGSLETSVFISKRTKIVEVNVSRSKFQQLLGLSSIGTINRAKPFHHAGIDDIPVDMADTFYTWYAGRVDEIKIDVE